MRFRWYGVAALLLLAMDAGAQAWAPQKNVEIVAGSIEYGQNYLAAFEAATGALLYGPYELDLRSLEVAQLDLDSKLELLIGSNGGEIGEIDVATGQLSPPLFDVNIPVEGLRFGDLTRDAVADFVLLAGGELRLLDGSTGLEVWRSPFVGESFGAEDRLALIDSDVDSLLEIVVDTSRGFAIFEAPEFDVFADGFESGDTSAWTSTQP